MLILWLFNIPNVRYWWSLKLLAVLCSISQTFYTLQRVLLIVLFKKLYCRVNHNLNNSRPLYFNFNRIWLALSQIFDSFKHSKCQQFFFEKRATKNTNFLIFFKEQLFCNAFWRKGQWTRFLKDYLRKSEVNSRFLSI